MLSDFMRKLFGKNGSKDIAKKRLQFALVYDRLEVSDDMLKEMQNEIVAVISRYFVIDRDQLKLDITRHDDLSALMLNTPIISAKTRQKAANPRVADKKGKGQKFSGAKNRAV
jgi:cell division topological specificity factor